MRMQALAEHLPDHADGFLITSESNIFYFTGVPCDAAILLVTRSGSYFFTDSRYLEAAERVITGAALCNTAKFIEEFPAACRKHGVRRLLVETSALTVRAARKYAALLPETELLYEDDLAFLSGFRRKKTSAETEKIIRAQRIAEQAFIQVLPAVQVGKTEKEIALELDYTMLRLGAEALSFQTIVVSGENSALPHGVPGGRKLQHGDCITFDFGAVAEGYHSDMTRTVFLGACNDEQRRVYETVLRAQQSALSVLRPGLACKDGDAAARSTIAAAGYGEAFGHSTGHGVGVEIHERPNLSPLSREILQVGDIVTVEPGIYLHGQFGVRIEDMAYITENGCQNLTNCEKNLRVLPV